MTPSGAGFEYLSKLTGWESTGRLTSPSLARIKAITAVLGHPQTAFPSVHVTGTNGKGSTTAMTAALLRAAGHRVGSYTSPHVCDLTERVQLDGKPVEHSVLDRALARVAEAATGCGVVPTWFEAMTAAGLLVFAERPVDVAVIEVGMLGRWDATNVVDGVVAVVTNVELDHTELAGPSRSAVAAEKAGIVKPGSMLVLGEPDPALRPLFLGHGQTRTCIAGEELRLRHRGGWGDGSIVDLYTATGSHRHVRLGAPGRHQAGNALLAVTAAEAIHGMALPTTTIDSVLGAIRLPGRMQTVATDPLVIVDGAHNRAAARALREAVDQIPTSGPRVLVYGTLAGRDPRAFLEAVHPDSFAHIVLTQPDSPRAVPATGLLAAAARDGPAATVCPEARVALRTARKLAGSDGLVLVTGSLSLVAPVAVAARSLQDTALVGGLP